MSTPAIVAKGLTKVYNGKLVAVDHIDFQVEQGEIFGFLGPNGAGKSTTINMLTTLIRPTAGEAEIEGIDVSKRPNDVRRIIGVVPQEYTADEDLTGLQNIMLVGDLYGIPRSITRQHAMELLKLVELDDAANRKVSTYSGGMRRRLELAAGLINYPRVLFLDEPTLGLDVQTRAVVWKYIKMLKENYGMTLFLTTHYLEEADSICDRIAIIDHGHIVRIGTPTQLKESIGGDVIVAEVAEVEPDASADIAKIPTVREVKKDGNRYRIKAEVGEEAAVKVIDTIKSKGLHVTKISVTKPSLDEVYMEFTGHGLREEEANEAQLVSMRRTIRKARS